ncbi:MAG: pyridoxal phosphate-dependent aminotransferase [bacterium]
MPRRVVTSHADRIDALVGPFLSELDNARRLAGRKGEQIADLSRFDLRLAPPAGSAAPANPAAQIRQVFAEYLADQYCVRLNPERELLLAPSGRAALMLLCCYFVESGRECLAPDPGFVAYRNLPLLFGGKVGRYALLQRNDFLPNLEQLTREKPDGKLSRLIFVNSPHNPSGAIADTDFYARLAKLAVAENLLVIADSSYCLNSIGSMPAPIFLENRKRFGAGLEMFSLSTNLCAPDLKLTVVAGPRRHITSLKSLAAVTGLTPSPPLLAAAAAYFESAKTLKSHLDLCRETIRNRTRLITASLSETGISYYPVITTPFVWVKLRRGRVSLAFARTLLRRKQVAVSPGSAFGEGGEGWIRVAANLEGAELRQALDLLIKHYQPIRSRMRDRRKQ